MTPMALIPQCSPHLSHCHAVTAAAHPSQQQQQESIIHHVQHSLVQHDSLGFGQKIAAQKP